MYIHAPGTMSRHSGAETKKNCYSISLASSERTSLALYSYQLTVTIEELWNWLCGDGCALYSTTSVVQMHPRESPILHSFLICIIISSVAGKIVIASNRKQDVL